MKKHKNKTSRKLILPIAVALLLVLGIAGSVYAFRPLPKKANVAQKPISSTQTSTETPVSPSDQTTVVSATPPTLSPATSTNTTTTQQTTTGTAPATVTAYEKISIPDSEDIDCKLTYSDGTTYQWHWLTINEQGSWVTDASGNNGHWVKTTNTANLCDDSVIGKQKS